MITTTKRWRSDSVAFIREAMGVKVEPWQARVIAAYRRPGKTDTAIALLPRPSLWRRLLARLGLVAVVLLLACATARVPRIYSRDGATDRDFFDEKRDCANYVDETCGRRNPCGPRFSDAFSFACDVYKSCMERNFDECMSVKGWTWIEPQRTAASVPPPGGQP